MSNQYKQLTKTQVKALIKKDGNFKGFIVGKNVSPYHFFAGWNLAHNVEIQSIEELDNTVSSWEYYNASSVLGKYCHFYQYI